MFDTLEKSVKLLKEDVAEVLKGLSGAEVAEEAEETEATAELQKPGRKKKASHA